MFNPNWDPMEALEALGRNQMILMDNQKIHNDHISQLVKKINNQQQQIDYLIKGLQQANSLNEMLTNHLMELIGKNNDQTTNNL
jgi:enoyl-[acyl-carrier-protein] reductase (NADH)